MLSDFRGGTFREASEREDLATRRGGLCLLPWKIRVHLWDTGAFRRELPIFPRIDSTGGCFSKVQWGRP